jgi:hypothetical protein
VIFLKMSSEDAAKIVISAGMVVPDYQARLRQLAEKARIEAAKVTAEGSSTLAKSHGAAAGVAPAAKTVTPPSGSGSGEGGGNDQAARKRRTASSHSKR